MCAGSSIIQGFIQRMQLILFQDENRDVIMQQVDYNVKKLLMTELNGKGSVLGHKRAGGSASLLCECRVRKG